MRPLTASTESINVSNRDETEQIKRRRISSDWQSRAYAYYDTVGELTYSANLVGSVMSRVRLYPAGLTSRDTAPSSLDDLDSLPEGLADATRTAMRLLASGDGGLSGLLNSAAIHMFLAGEFWLVQVPATTFAPERWQVRSIDEVVVQEPTRGRTSRIFLKPNETANSTQLIALPDSAYVARIWRPHPRYSQDAAANTRALLDLFDELLLLNRYARGAERSRLNAGLLYIPDEISVSGASDGLDADPVDPGQTAGYDLIDDVDDGILDELMAAMTTPIADESSASSVVPLLLRGPSEYGDKIHYLKFDRPYDAQLTQRADKVVDRILAGLDLPKDIVTGLANVRYSNSLAISDSLYTSHIEPLALLLCDALTDAFLHPILLSKGFTLDEIENIVVWYDPSAVTTKPNKAEASNLGFDNGSLSWEAWRRYNGFSEADAASPEELIKRQALLRAAFSDQLSESAFRLLAPGFMDATREQSLATSSAPVPDNVQQLLSGGDPSSAPAAPPAAAESDPATASQGGIAPAPQGVAAPQQSRTVAPTSDPASDNPELVGPAQ